MNINIDSAHENYVGVIAFDLDGTLIRGIRHSWSLLWKAVGVSRTEAIQYQKDFSAGKISYGQWVNHDFEVLKKNCLTKEKINNAIQSARCTLTKNFAEAMSKLRKSGYITAVISGGVDAVLKYFLPNPYKFFDVIYINQLVWDDNGQLSSIIPTKYDWDSNKKGVLGKCGGLKKICADYGISINNSVFVGNDYNDLNVLQIAGRKILFSAESFKDINNFSGLHIEPKNDLMLVADYILN